MSADIIECNIANAINEDISNDKYSQNAKAGNVRIIF